VSFDIWFQKFRDGREAAFPRAIVECQFEKYPNAYDERHSQWTVWFDEGHVAEFGIGATPEVEGFSLSRPPAVIELWNGLFAILRDAEGVFYWNGGGVVASREILTHLHPELREAMSNPPVVSSGRDILDAIEEKGMWRSETAG
jgi:hypothetical protein